MRQNI